MAEGALAPVAGLATHSSACRCSPEWRAQRGRAEPTSQAMAVRAAGMGKQPCRETSAPSPLGQKGKTQGPTSAPQMWGQTCEEGGMTKWVQVLQEEVGVGLLCKLIMLMKCQQLCGGTWMWSQARREAGNLPSGLGSGWSREAAGLLPILPHPHLPGKPPRAPCFGLIELHGSTFILSFFLLEFSARGR